MHELSICQSLVSQLEQVAATHHASRVTALRVLIGPLSGVEAQLLNQAFPIAAAGSIADRATLTLDTLPLKVRCRQCGAETEALPNRLLCGACGDWRTEVISGDELLLADVELITDSTTEIEPQKDATHV